MLATVILTGCTAAPAAPPSKEIAVPLEARPTPEPTPMRTATQIVESPPVRIEVPSAGIDSPVAWFELANNSFDPGSDQLLPVWPTNFGSPAAGDSALYIGGHSSRLEAGHADTVFNALFDRSSQQPRVAVGDVIFISTEAGQRLCYSVTYTDIIEKATLEVAVDHPAWNVYPKEAVLFTCAQYRENIPSTRELVIKAELGGGGCN